MKAGVVSTEPTVRQPADILSGWSVRRPLLVAGLSATVATAVALWLTPLWAVIVALLLPLLFFIAYFRRPMAVLILLTASLFLLAGAGYCVARVRPLTELDGQQDTITGQVVALPASGNMVTLRITAADRVPAGSLVAMYCPGETAPQLGDVLTAEVELSRVTYSPAARYADGVYLYAFPLVRDEQHVLLQRADTASLTATVRSLRQRLSSALNRVLSGEESAVLEALCLGHRESLSPATEDAFRTGGLSHLLVVSGLHLSFVAVAVRALLRRCGMGIRLSAALTIPVIGLFILLVGATPSILRAGTMCLVWLLGILLWRRSDGLNSLGLAAILLLLNNPYTLLSVGFQLSFLATAGVLWLTPRLCRWLYRLPAPTTPLEACWRRVMTAVYTGAAACTSALLFTLPVATHYYGGFPILSVVANVLAVAPASLALLLGWAGMLCCQTPLLSWLGRPLLLAAGYVARYLTTVARMCSPTGSYIPVTDTWQLVLLTGLCLLFIYAICRPVPRRWLVTGVTTITLLALMVGLPLTRGVTRMTVIPSDEGVTLLIRQDDRAALILTDSADLENALWEARNARLDAVFIGAGDATDAPYLAELCRQSGHPVLYTADRSSWAAGLPRSLTPVGEGDTVTLWEGCSLTRLPEGGYRVDTPGAPVLIGTAADGKLTVYDGAPSQWPDAYCVVLTTTKELAKERPEIPENTLVLTETDDSVTFTARPGGEWSVLPWQ